MDPAGLPVIEQNRTACIFGFLMTHQGESKSHSLKQPRRLQNCSQKIQPAGFYFKTINRCFYFTENHFGRLLLKPIWSFTTIQWNALEVQSRGTRRLFYTKARKSIRVAILLPSISDAVLRLKMVSDGKDVPLQLDGCDWCRSSLVGRRKSTVLQHEGAFRS